MQKLPPNGFPSNSISSDDRRLLVRAQLGLLLRRANHGVPVRADDLIRLAAFADDRLSASIGDLG
jgi:hypothetical protein